MTGNPTINRALGYDYLYVAEGVTWDWEGAHQACLQKGFYLARMESEEENMFVHHYQ